MSTWLRKAVIVGAFTMVCTSFSLAYPSNGTALTPSQRTKIQALERKGRAELSAVRNGLGQPAEKKSKMEAISKKYRDAELAILTPAQRAELEKQLAARKVMAAKLIAIQKSLTPQQRDKGQALRKNFQRKAVAVYQNKKLSNAQKKAQYMKLQLQQNAAMRALLTPQQRAALPR